MIKRKENPFNICFEKWIKIVYSSQIYAFNTTGNENDVSKISMKMFFEFSKFKRRKKYIISNNSSKWRRLRKIKYKTFKEKSVPTNHDLETFNRCEFINNYSNQTIIMIGNQTCL